MTQLSLVLFLWLFIFHLPWALSAPHPIAERDPAPSSPQAKAGGTTFVGSTDDSYGVTIWLGTRYAKSPTEALRLQSPEKVDNGGTIVTQSFGAQRFQMDPLANANISQDCLFLNIYKLPKATLHEKGDDEASDSLPVMFWIHGGEFSDGSRQIYDSRSLVNTSVILETTTIVIIINY